MTTEGQPGSPDWLEPLLRCLTRQLRPADAPRLGALVDRLLDDVAGLVVAEADDPLPAVHVPALVGEAVAPDGAPIEILAGCATAFLGIRLLDDLMDGDAPRLLTGASSGEILLVSQYLHGEAHRMVAEVVAANGTPLVGQRFRRMIATMAEGQLDDEEPLGPTTSPDDTARKVERKSAAMLAQFAAIGALSAGAAPQVAAAAFDYGRHLGFARQYLNDLRDLMQPGASDLRTRKATMVMVLAVGALDPDERAAFIDAVGHAADDAAAHDALLSQRNVQRAIGDVAVLAGQHLARVEAAACGITGRSASRTRLTDAAEPVARALDALITNSSDGP